MRSDGGRISCARIVRRWRLFFVWKRGQSAIAEKALQALRVVERCAGHVCTRIFEAREIDPWTTGATESAKAGRVEARVSAVRSALGTCILVRSNLIRIAR